MKKLLALTFIFSFLLISCSGSKKLPEGAPPKIKDKALRQKMQTSENTFQTLEIRATGDFKDDNTSQGFRLMVRILKDSLIWVDIADPILGIKAARAVVYKDSVAFINRLQKEYYTGPLAQLQQKLKMDFGYEALQAILSANLAFGVNEDFETYYQPGYYVLADHLPDNTENRNPSASEKFHEVYVDPIYFKPARQQLEQPGLKREYEILYRSIKPRDDILYPDNIRITYTQDSPATLKLDIREVEKNKTLNFPFSIPDGYGKMR